MRLDLAERSALVALLVEYGPDQPTLCDGWQTRDLAAHLAIRDRRPDVMPGVLIPAFAGWTKQVQDSYARKPWPELVELVRSGPPRWSPMSVPKIGALANTAEFFVHHEDIRRAQADWQPRPVDAARDAALWSSLGTTAKLALRKTPGGLLLRTPDGKEIVVRKGSPAVTVTGEVGELVLFVSGRAEHRCEFDGAPAAVAALQASDRAL